MIPGYNNYYFTWYLDNNIVSCAFHCVYIRCLVCLQNDLTPKHEHETTMAGHRIASYQTLLYLFMFVAIGTCAFRDCHRPGLPSYYEARIKKYTINCFLFIFDVATRFRDKFSSLRGFQTANHTKRLSTHGLYGFQRDQSTVFKFSYCRLHPISVIVVYEDGVENHSRNTYFSLSPRSLLSILSNSFYFRAIVDYEINTRREIVHDRFEPRD